MNINKTQKIVVGIATAILTALPFMLFIFWMGLIIIAVLTSDNYYGKTPDAFVFFFIFLIFAQILWRGLRFLLLIFYQTHIIMNDEASNQYRVLFSLGNIFIAFISMPFYYFVYIYPENIPEWALNKSEPVVEEVVEVKPKAKKPRAKKKSAKKKTE